MSEIRFETLGPGDYERAKKILDRAKHPGFVGRELFYRCATTGSATVAVLDGQDVGVALIAKDKLNAMSVITSAQGHGVGGALIAKLQPRWVNAIAERVPWFEKRGYKPFGPARVSQNGKHAQQLMERVALVEAGDVSSIVTETSATPTVSRAPEPPEDPSPTFLELLDEEPVDRAKAELAILDGLMAKAVMAEKFESALKILDAAHTLLQRHGRR